VRFYQLAVVGARFRLPHEVRKPGRYRGHGAQRKNQQGDTPASAAPRLIGLQVTPA
jgi:hypothetical protein